MGNITKKYWKWNDTLNRAEFKLDGSIDDLLRRNLVIATDEVGRYTTVGEDPWSIDVVDGRICSLCYRGDKFFSFTGFERECWDLELYKFEYRMNRILEKTDEHYSGDRLYVVFRDNFVAIAMIIKGTESGLKQESTGSSWRKEEERKIIAFIGLSVITFLLAYFGGFSIAIGFSEGVRINLLYIPTVLSVLLLFFLAIEKIFDLVKRK